MKFNVAILVAGLSLTAVSCTSYHDKAKSGFLKSCMESAKASANGQISDALIKEYCDCSADKIMDGSTDEQIKEMAENTASPEVQQRQMSLAAPCMQDLQRKVAAQSGTAAPVQ